MRANEFVTNSVHKQLQRNCKQFLNEANIDVNNIANTKLLYRGVSRTIPTMQRIECPHHRSPMNTDPQVHQIIDAWFVKYTRVGYRSNAFFGTGDFKNAEFYGQPCAIFPVGDYEYCWSPNVKDLTITLQQNNTEISTATKSNTLEVAVDNMLKKSKYLCNVRLDEAIASGNEVMIHCKSAFIVPLEELT
jgi:hypothetical protein